MKIMVGSKNPAKVAAVAEIIKDYPLLAGAEVIGMEVESSIAEQPLTLEETIQGAMNRAQAAFKDCDYSVGLESGLFPVPHTKSGYMDTGVCAIFDGQTYHLGLSAPFEYPKEITRLVVEEGKNVSAAAKETQLTDHPYIGYDQGVIGIVSHGRITRKDYTKQAIASALIHLENPELY